MAAPPVPTPEDFADPASDPAVRSAAAEDARFMEIALRLAGRMLGRVAPNPAVGCVLVKDGLVIARGWTAPGGRPHAETLALQRAGEAARGATAHVTLEPCAHHGRTPPCADALVAAGLARVVVAMTDPDPRTAGRGIARLREAGITVDVGLLADEARALNRGFVLKVTQNRPLVAVKLATSLDGRIAAAGGDARWITGEAARRHAHLLRARHDAILIGGRTARIDDPELTCRLPGLEQASPVRVVLTRRRALEAGSRLAAGAHRVPVWLLLPEGAGAPGLPAPDPDEPGRPGLHAVTFASPPDADAGETARAILAALAGAGITRLLVEGGGEVAGLFVKTGLFDRLYHFTGNCVIGADGVPALPALGLAAMADAPRLRLVETRALEETVLSVYEPEAATA